MAETSADVIKHYLDDAIAAEKSFEAQLQGFAKEAEDPAAQALFHQHALETRSQYEKLTARLEALGGSTSTAKSIWAHIFGLGSKTAQVEQEKQERTTQDLTIAYAIENSEVAMYESLIAMSEAAGDFETGTLAREIQAQEKDTADKIWNLIPSAALHAYRRVVDGQPVGSTKRTTTASTLI